MARANVDRVFEGQWLFRANRLINSGFFAKRQISAQREEFEQRNFSDC
jgi:hypothetical protein